MKRRINKKGDELLTGTVVFLILLIIFIVPFFLYINRESKLAPVFEELYSKQIALLIDKSLAGTNISMDISKLYKVSKDNKYKGDLINITNKFHTVHVKLSSGKGYSYKYFNDENILWNIKEKEKRLYIYVLKK